LGSTPTDLRKWWREDELAFVKLSNLHTCLIAIAPRYPAPFHFVYYLTHDDVRQLLGSCLMYYEGILHTHIWLSVVCLFNLCILCILALLALFRIVWRKSLKLIWKMKASKCYTHNIYIPSIYMYVWDSRLTFFSSLCPKNDLAETFPILSLWILHSPARSIIKLMEIPVEEIIHLYSYTCEDKLSKHFILHSA